MSVMTYKSQHQNIVQGIELNYNTEENPKIRDQIRSFRDLAHGWHYGEGRGATELAIETALTIHSHFIEHGITEIEVFPDVNGGILVSGYHEKHTLEVFCNQGGHADILHEINDKVLHERNDVPMDEIVEYLGGLPWRSKKLFDSFILGTTVGTSGDLQVLPSKIHQMVVCRSLTPNVQKKAAKPNVNTYGVFITPILQGILLSFGESTLPSYQKRLYSNTNCQLLETNAI